MRFKTLGPASLVHGHPRLFITPDRLPEFRRALLLPHRKRYRAMLFDKLEPLLTSAPDLRSRIRHAPEHLALALGQAWQLTRDKRYAVAARWLMEAIEEFVHVTPIGYDTWGVAAEAAGLLYDWLHDYWKSQRLDERAARIALYCARRALDETLRVYILDDWHNYGLGLQSGALAGALAVGNDFPKLEDGTLLKTLHAFHFTGLKVDEVFLQDAYQVPPTTRCLDRALRANNNGFFSGLSEATGGYHSVDVWEFVKLANWWTTAIKPAVRQNKIVWPEFVLAGEATLHTIRPDGLITPLGDSLPSKPHWRQATIVLHLHARTPRPYFAAWLEKNIELCASPYPSHLLLHARAPQKTVVSATMPTFAHFDPVTLMRSGWDEDATFAIFRCGRFAGGHNHLDSNAFAIYRGGALATESGGMDYSSAAHTEYAPRTIAHNTILVRNPAEKFWYGRHRKETVNDGGQRIMRVAYAPPHDVTGGPCAVLTQERRERFADLLDTGHYVAAEAGELADYVAGDATRAYTSPWSGIGDNPSRRVEEFVRQILFIKPDLFIVFDRVEATCAHFEKKWLLHTMAAPVVCENNRRRAAAGGIHELPPDALYEFAYKRGRLTVFPLLPEARVVRAVGGKGYECWVDHGVDAPGGKNYPAPSGQRETGAWRIEVSPRKKSLRDCFLTVLHAGLRRERAAREVLRCDAEVSGGHVRVIIERLERGTWRVAASASFYTEGKVSVEYEVNGRRGEHSSPAPKRVRQARP
ncbi:MAG TPA: heparinase II/III family protein [Planctomycetota bacterium]|nr:heparinase II/III family protein [Planctomycetota bacterium]